MKQLIVLFAICLISCKDNLQTEISDGILLDSIRVKNVTGRNSISSEKSSISYYFRSEIELDNSFYEITSNKRQVTFKNKKKDKTKNGYYYLFQFYDFDYNVFTLKKMINNYNDLISFNANNLSINNKMKINLISNKKTKIIYTLDGDDIEKNDSIALNSSSFLKPKFYSLPKK